MASLQSKSTFFKHHLTGEAWPACRAIVPLQTPLDRRGMLLAWSLYIVRTSTIAKNRHLNIVLRAELYLRTGTYDRPNLAKALAIDAYPRIALVNMDDRPDRVGERFLNPLRMKHHLRSGNQKKKTRFAGLFFLTGLWPVLPLGQCPPSKSAPKDFAHACAPKTLKYGLQR